MTAGHHAILAGFGFSLGAAVGSFLNVCAWRLPRGESLVRPGSRCPRCRNPIAARDNVPVLGWLLLRGRCRRCREPISARYPLVEAAVGALFSGVFLADLALDPVERAPSTLPFLLTYHLALTALLVTATLIAVDERRPRLSRPRERAAGSGFVITVVAVAAVTAAASNDALSLTLNAMLFAVFLSRVGPTERPAGAGR